MSVHIQLDKFVLLVIYVLIGLNILYILLTKKSKKIIIKKKLTIVSYGFTKYIIIDTNNNIFEINNSVWFGKFNSLDDWIKINLNKKYNINYYGLPNSIFGTKYQIVDIV